MEKLESFISEEAIQARVKELALEIRKDYGDEDVLLLGVLKGSLLFLADLCRYLGSNIKVDFLQVSSYEGGTRSSGNVQIRKDLDINIHDQNVLIVEDIIDSGLTLQHIRELLSTRKPKQLKVVTLLSKPERRLHNIEVDYIGFDIPDKFVVGYGLDYEEYYRNLPYIAILQL